MRKHVHRLLNVPILRLTIRFYFLVEIIWNWYCEYILMSLKRGLLSKFHFSTRMHVCWILIGRFWNCCNFLKNDPNNIKLILVVYHWNVFWMVSKVILYRTHVRVCARALLFRHFSDTTMVIAFELKTEINSNFYSRFMTWMPKEWCQEKLSWSKSRTRECACIVISDV